MELSTSKEDNMNNSTGFRIPAPPKDIVVRRAPKATQPVRHGAVFQGHLTTPEGETFAVYHGDIGI